MWGRGRSFRADYGWENAKVGANATVVKNVAANTTVVGTAAHKTESAKSCAFTPYGINAKDADPYDKRIAELEKEIKRLREELRAGEMMRFSNVILL